MSAVKTTPWASLGMDRLLVRLQIAVLAIGTAFAWFTLVGDFRRFFSACGRVFEWSGCVVTNPLPTPCFYGAPAFLAAFDGYGASNRLRFF